LKITINDKEQTLQVETDPPWGEMQRLLKESHKAGENGKPEIDMMLFLDRLLEMVIVGSDGDFNIKDRTKVKQLPTSIMTKLIGGVTKLLPLQSYLDNMGDLANMSSQQ
jgi:hypothetical protein